MAFFGLTQLGPQSTFNVNLISLQNFTCFSEDDFRASFDKHSGGGASIPLDKVGPMLEGVFGGFAPEQEMEALLAALQHFGGDISFDHVMTSVAAVAGGKAATAQGYTSFLDWKEDLHRHTRIKYDPKDAWVEPLTEAQKYGWQRGGAEWATKRWPKVSSAETRYADSMVRQGEDYLS